MLINVNFPHLLFLPYLCFWELGSRMKYFRGNNSVSEGQSPLPSSYKPHNSALCDLFPERPPTEPIPTAFKMARAWWAGQTYDWSASYKLRNNIETLTLGISLREYAGISTPHPTAMPLQIPAESHNIIKRKTPQYNQNLIADQSSNIGIIFIVIGQNFRHMSKSYCRVKSEETGRTIQIPKLWKLGAGKAIYTMRKILFPGLFGILMKHAISISNSCFFKPDNKWLGFPTQTYWKEKQCFRNHMLVFVSFTCVFKTKYILGGLICSKFHVKIWLA